MYLYLQTTNLRPIRTTKMTKHHLNDIILMSGQTYKINKNIGKLEANWIESQLGIHLWLKMLGIAARVEILTHRILVMPPAKHTFVSTLEAQDMT